MENNNRSKGKNIVSFPDDYISFDLETTGLYPKYDEIIEIGAIKVHNGMIIDTFQTLIKPNEPICDYVSELTGITNEMVKNSPKIKEVITSFRNFVGDNIILGHNVNFDVNFMYDAFICFDNMPFDNDYIDTMRIARKLYPELKHHRLKDIVTKLNVTVENYHRALADCEATSACFEAMRKEITLKYSDIETFCDLFKPKVLNAKELSASVTDFDETHPLYGKSCVFTGTLEKMSRREAMQVVLNLGGLCENSVTKNTNFLILGNNDYCTTIKDGKSTKQKKAEKYKLAGQDIDIIPESVFYDMLND